MPLVRILDLLFLLRLSVTTIEVEPLLTRYWHFQKVGRYGYRPVLVEELRVVVDLRQRLLHRHHLTLKSLALAMWSFTTRMLFHDIFELRHIDLRNLASALFGVVLLKN